MDGKKQRGDKFEKVVHSIDIKGVKSWENDENYELFCLEM